jgi:hypothetical protein
VTRAPRLRPDLDGQVAQLVLVGDQVQRDGLPGPEQGRPGPGHRGAGLHDLWGLGSTTADATPSLLVLAGWAALVTAASIRVFKRSAMN